MSRWYSALKNGEVVQRGTFTDEALVHLAFPEPEFTLLLDQRMEFAPVTPDYQELRRMAYPPLADFADATYWQSQGDDSKMVAYLAAVEAVKLRYPKPADAPEDALTG